MLGRTALILGGAATAQVARDGDVSQPADRDRSHHLGTYAAPIALMVPAGPERLDDSFPAGQAFGANQDGRIADEHNRPDLADVRAEGQQANRLGGHHHAYGAADLAAISVGYIQVRELRKPGRDRPGRIGAESVDAVGCGSEQLIHDRIRGVGLGEVSANPLVDLVIIGKASLKSC
jgi:hypothetical protein